MARIKDTLYSEEYNTYMDRSVDIDLYKLEVRLNALASDRLDLDAEGEMLLQIDEISEARLVRESRMKPQPKSNTITKNLLIKILAAIFMVVLFSWAAVAKNLTVWCLVSDFNTQCIYYNLDSCQSDAEQFGGVCTPKQINEGE